MLRPQGWPRTAWEQQLGTLPAVDAGPLAATFTAASRDARAARAVLTPALAGLTAGPKPPGTVVIDGRHLLMLWDGPLTTETLERATAFLREVLRCLPADLPARRGPVDGSRLSGIARYLVDVGGLPIELPWSAGRAGRDLAGADPFVGWRRGV